MRNVLSKNKPEEYIKLFDKKGEIGLYKWAVGEGVVSLSVCESPDVMFLDLAEYFFALSRSTGNKKYFVVGKIFRKAAHKLYRVLFILKPDHQINSRFLNIINCSAG
jgi:hypothetical protein